MFRKIFSVIAAISLTALFALGESRQSSAAAQAQSGTRTNFSDMTLEISTMDLLGANSMIVGWTVKKTGTVTITQPYEISLELSRSGVTERLGKTASASATSVTFDLRGISAEKRARLFGPNLKATVIVKATFLRHQGGRTFKSIIEANKTKTFSAADAGPIAK